MARASQVAPSPWAPSAPCRALNGPRRHADGADDTPQARRAPRGPPAGASAPVSKGPRMLLSAAAAAARLPLRPRLRRLAVARGRRRAARRRGPRGRLELGARLVAGDRRARRRRGGLRAPGAARARGPRPRRAGHDDAARARGPAAQRGAALRHRARPERGARLPAHAAHHGAPARARRRGAQRRAALRRGRRRHGAARHARDRLPAVATRSAAGERLDAGTTRAVALLAAAPGALRAKVSPAVDRRSRVDGLAARRAAHRFGRAERPGAKWLAAARVLADRSSAGATYVDVRLPERPVAGGLVDPAQQAAAQLRRRRRSPRRRRREPSRRSRPRRRRPLRRFPPEADPRPRVEGPDGWNPRLRIEGPPCCTKTCHAYTGFDTGQTPCLPCMRPYRWSERQNPQR